MGNRNIVMDSTGKVIGEYNTSLTCFFLVNEVVSKYNPGRSLMFEVDRINEILEPVYKKCDGYENVQLLLFINDESDFDESDIDSFNLAIEKYSLANDGPKQHLVFMRDLLLKHKVLKTKYMYTTCAFTISSAQPD